MTTIYDPETIRNMNELFERDYDYIELVTWVHNHLSLVDKKPNPVPKNPFDILELGEGRCGEFSILYVAACVSQGYDARLVIILRGSNHEWTEVKVNGSWVHVDPTSPPGIYVNDPELYQRWNKTMSLVVAFEKDSYEIITEKYSD
jgi:hypothetical protein